MSKYWKCPNCDAFFEKTAPMKDGERWYQQHGHIIQEQLQANHKGKIPFDDHPPCPNCKQRFHLLALVSGKYDYIPHFLPKPSREQLGKEFLNIFKVLVREAALRDGQARAVMEFDTVRDEAIKRAAQLLYEKYEVAQTEFPEVVSRSVSK